MYKLTSTANIIRDGDGANIPPDPRNADYARYLAWIKAGNTPTLADPVALIVTPPDKTDRLADLLIAKGVLKQSDIAGLKDAQ